MSEAGAITIAPVLDVDRLLAPIAGDAPAGADFQYDPAFDKLKQARREADAIEQRPREADEEPGARSSAMRGAWAAIADQAVEILSRRAKDLQSTLWLLEALSRLEGFRGSMTGLRILAGIVDTYWDSFFPNIDPGDDEPLGYRAGLMSWVDERLPAVLKSAPICAPPDSYTLFHYESTLKTGDERKALLADGWPTTEQFDAAMKASALPWLERALAEIVACREAVDALARVCDERMVSRRTTPTGGVRVETLLSFGRLRETLETAQWLVDKAAKPRRPTAAAPSAAGSDAAATASADGASSNGAPPSGSAIAGVDGGWLEARDLVRRNQIDGLRALETRLRDASSGRDRFLRKLEFADVCLEAGMYALAYPLYDDVTRTIVDRTLSEWEDRAVLVRAWKGLAECCDKLALILPNTESRGREAADQIRTLTEG